MLGSESISELSGAFSPPTFFFYDFKFFAHLAGNGRIFFRPPGQVR